MVHRRWLAAVGLGVALAAATPPASIRAGQDPRGRARQAYASAVELEAKGDYAGALPLLWEAAGLAPDEPDIQQRLGEALERLGALDAAIDAYKLALSARPDFRKASNSLILALVKAGRGAEATERARALVAVAPDDPDAHFTLGLALSEQDVAPAIASFRRALELAPHHALARYNLALVLKRADRLSDAVDELLRLLDVEPRAEAHYTLGVIYQHQGHLEQARRAFVAALALDPRSADAHYALGIVLKAQGDWTASAASLQRAVALQPQQSAARYALAQVLRLGGKEADGDAELAEAQRLSEATGRQREAIVWTAVGTKKFEAADLSGAVDCFRRAIAAFEAHAPAHFQLGRTLLALGQRDAARQAFARAAELDPSLVSPHKMR